MMASGRTPPPSETAGLANDSLSCSVLSRRQRSKELAQKRRTTYKSIMDELTQALPFPKDVVSQLDYNSRLRLALCFFRLKSLMGHTDEQHSTLADRSSVVEVKEKEMNLSLLTKGNAGMMQDLMNEALDGFLVVLLTDGTITYVSESIHKHLGLFQSEHIGISLYDLVLEEDEESVKKAIQAAQHTAMARLTHNASADVGFFCRMKCSRFKVTNTISKTPGYKLVYISGTLKLSGHNACLVAVVRPVSPPSILELKVEGNMFVTHYSMEMKCTFFDGRLKQLMGYAKDDLLGDVVFTLHHHDDTEATLECSRGVMSRGEGLSGYFRFLTRHGYYLWLQTRATVMYDSRTGKPSYIVCMNFVIDKEKGDLALKNRAIKAKEEEPPVIKELDSRSHDPFPLVSREDGKVVNPLNQTTDQSDLVNEVTSSSSPDNKCVDSVPSSVDTALPDSTSSEPDLNVGIIRTNTGMTSRTSDTGYASSTNCAGEISMFSPNSGVFEVSSLSSNSPSSDESNPQRKSSCETASSSSAALGIVSFGNTENTFQSNDHPSITSNYFQNSAISSSSAAKTHPQSVLSAKSTAPQPMTSSHAAPPSTANQPQQSPHLSSLLMSDSSQGYSIPPSTPQVNVGNQQRDATQHLGKRNAVGTSYIKQEMMSTMQQGYPYNVPPNQYGSFPQIGVTYPQQQTNGSHVNTVAPPLNHMSPQNHTVVSAAGQPNVMAQEYQQYFTPPSSNNSVFQPHDFLPVWQNQIVIKSEFPNPAMNGSQQIPPSNGHTIPPLVSDFPQHLSHSSTRHPTNIQSSFNTVSNQQLPPPLGDQNVNVPPYGGQGLPDQLPLLTGDDLRVLDDIGNYAPQNTNPQQYF